MMMVSKKKCAVNHSERTAIITTPSSVNLIWRAYNAKATTASTNNCVVTETKVSQDNQHLK